MAASREQVAAGAVVLLGLALRLWGVGAQSFSMDELTEFGIARQSIGRIMAAPDGFPPLYDLILHGWLAAFGDGGARLLSVLFGTLALVSVWRMARRAGGAEAGIAAAFALAISPIHVWYSQEARAYALYILIAGVALTFLFRALETDRPRDWRAYAGAATVGLYTHYYFALLIAAGLVIVALERRSWRRAAPALAALGWAIPLCLPLAWLLRIDFGYWSGAVYPETHFTPAAALYTWFTLVAGFAIGPSTRELHTMGAARAAVAAAPGLALAAAATLALGTQGLAAVDRRIWGRRLLVLGIVPIALCGLSSALLGIGYRVRYVAWLAIPAALLFGAGLTRIRISRVAAAGAVSLLVLAALSLWNHQRDERYMTEDTRAAAEYLVARSAPGAAIFVASGYMAGPLNYYLPPSRRAVPLPRMDRVTDAAPALRMVHDSTGPGRPFWLIYSRPFDADPRGELLAQLTASARLMLRAHFAGVDLYAGEGF